MTAHDPGWIGVWLLVAGAAVILAELVLGAAWSARLARRSRVTAARLASERRMIQEDMEKLRASLEEMERLWRPYARVLRWLRHPLTIALMESYSRRRAAAR